MGRGAVNFDAGFYLQAVSLAGQAARWAIDAFRRWRGRPGEHQADSYIQVIVACYGDECQSPRTWMPWTLWTAWTCGRTGGQQPRGAGYPLPGVRYPTPAARRARRQVRRGGDESWGCRGRIRCRPHGRHRRC